MRWMTTFLTMCVCLFCFAGEANAGKEDSVTVVYTDNPTHDVVGTGFFIERHLVVTNRHVVGDSKLVVVNVRGKLRIGKVVMVSNTADLALIKITGRGQRHLRMCRKTAKTGNKVEVWAYDNTIFSKKAGVIINTWVYAFLSTSVSFSGNSGSPTIRNGCVVGVLSGGNDEGNISYHESGYRLRQLLRSYKTQEKLKSKTKGNK